MFISDTHLPQVLPPDYYTSEEQYQRELDLLFKPGWHAVGCLDDLAKDGDYTTFNLLGYPLILWKASGEVHTFLNVCPHRFSTLRDKPCGHLDRLHCQYHGWEFDETGNTRKIPDARSFRPMERGVLGLKKFRTEMLGQMVFVSLAEEGPSLKESLGPGYEIGQELFSAGRRVFSTIEYISEANWKAKVENTLESYHIESVHPSTFGKQPDAAICDHELTPNWTTFSTTEPARTGFERYMNRVLHKMADVPFNQQYTHYLYYPSITFMKTGLFTVCETTLPLSPGRTKVYIKLFCNLGPKPQSIWSRIMFRAVRRAVGPFFVKVAGEDAGINACVQRGLSAPLHPSKGLISIREERLYHFQEFIKRATAPGSNGYHPPVPSPLEAGVCQAHV